jgi:FkbM family methyltransferase
MKRFFRNIVIKLVAIFVGTEPKVHRIPFGPLKGRYIYLAFHISPRMYLGIDEPWIAELANKFIRSGHVIYDIGAHVGYTSLLFAEKLNGTGTVYAFDILPSTVENYLKKTLAVNEFDNISVHNIGLGQSSQTIKLPVGPTAMTSIYSTSDQKEHIELCQVAPLDQYIREHQLAHPTLMKIDVEGAEIDCLRGGQEIIRKQNPVMFIEFHTLDLLKEGYWLLNSWDYCLTTQDTKIIDPEFLESRQQFHQTVLCLPKGKVQ